ncbi:hypothetical protein [Agrobacterium radiobacter]|uniref:hypothetical protein n=1 Tax=Agrobacterium radiobacter TaxID=362 RepID=UPI003CE55693
MVISRVEIAAPKGQSLSVEDLLLDQRAEQRRKIAAQNLRRNIGRGTQGENERDADGKTRQTERQDHPAGRRQDG